MGSFNRKNERILISRFLQKKRYQRSSLVASHRILVKQLRACDLASTLPTATALDLLAKLDEAYAECHLSWQNVLSGSEPAMQDQPPPAPRHARGITPDDGDGDDEHPHSRRRIKIQGVITACIDSGVREGLLQMHESEGSWTARMRLAELGDSSVDHTWLWRLNPRHGAILEADEYIDSVRFRLGCAGPVEPITCAACNSGILDTGAAHASCCALGEATRGHNAVSSLLHAAAAVRSYR